MSNDDHLGTNTPPQAEQWVSPSGTPPIPQPASARPHARRRGRPVLLVALLCVIVGLLSAREAIRAIDWSTIFLFAGTLALAEALETTGVGHLIAGLVVALCGGEINYYLLITVLFLFCGLITQFMSNTAACALLAPIGLQIAQGLGVAPKSVLIVVAAAACSSYLTPMATPPNTLVFGCGGFRFQDFLKAGMPLFLLTYLLCILIVPAVWPI